MGTWSTDFNEYSVGPMPADWSELGTAVTITIVDGTGVGANIGGTNAMYFDNSLNGNSGGRWSIPDYAPMPPTGYRETLSRNRTDDGLYANSVRLQIGTMMTARNANRYDAVGLVQPSTGVSTKTIGWRLRNSDGIHEDINIGTTIANIDMGDWVWMRVRWDYDTTTTHAKFWQGDVTDEPGGWDVSFDYSTYGQVSTLYPDDLFGIFNYNFRNGTTQYCDYFACGTNEAAPSPGGGPTPVVQVNNAPIIGSAF